MGVVGLWRVAIMGRGTKKVENHCPKHTIWLKQNADHHNLSNITAVIQVFQTSVKLQKFTEICFSID